MSKIIPPSNVDGAKFAGSPLSVVTNITATTGGILSDADAVKFAGLGVGADITAVLGGTNITVTSGDGPIPTVNLDATITDLTSVTSTDFFGALTGNATTAATVTGAAQTAITSVGTLTGLTLSGDLILTGTAKVDGRDVAADGTKLDGIEILADVTDAASIAAAGAVMESDTTTTLMQFVEEATDLGGGSSSDSKLASQLSIKTYVDAQILTEDTFAELNDTNISTPAAGHIAIYDGSDSWDNKAISGDINISADGTATIQANSVDLTADVTGTLPAANGGTGLTAITTLLNSNTTASDLSDFDTEVSNNTDVTANTAKTTNATHTGEVTGSGALTIADDIIDVDNLKADNAPTNNHVLTVNSSGGLTWAAADDGHSIKEESGSALTTRTNMTFIGELVEAVDNAVDDSTDILINAKTAWLYG